MPNDSLKILLDVLDVPHSIHGCFIRGEYFKSVVPELAGSVIHSE